MRPDFCEMFAINGMQRTFRGYLIGDSETGQGLREGLLDPSAASPLPPSATGECDADRERDRLRPLLSLRSSRLRESERRALRDRLRLRLRPRRRAGLRDRLRVRERDLQQFHYIGRRGRGETEAREEHEEQQQAKGRRAAAPRWWLGKTQTRRVLPTSGAWLTRDTERLHGYSFCTAQLSQHVVVRCDSDNDAASAQLPADKEAGTQLVQTTLLSIAAPSTRTVSRQSSTRTQPRPSLFPSSSQARRTVAPTYRRRDRPPPRSLSRSSSGRS